MDAIFSWQTLILKESPTDVIVKSLVDIVLTQQS